MVESPALLLLVSLVVACAPEPTRPARLEVTDLLAGDSAGFEQAIAPRPFAFPDDHGAHPGFRTEWWYFTGNLASAEGERFGFQLTFFRNQLRPQPVARASAWAADTVFMAHFALTDAKAGRFHAFERFSRGALGLAGVEASPFRVWLEDWQVSGPSLETSTLEARQGELAFELQLSPGKGVVMQGKKGLSQKGPEPGNASFYYSLPRLPARGTLTMGDRRHNVAGEVWLDREWSTSALSPGVVGWDWLSLQLDDGRELMFYRLRRADGGATAESSGSLVAADGAVTAVPLESLRLESVGTWTSPATGAPYPVRWRLALPAEGLELEISPLLEAQELDLSVRYWEGAIAATGTSAGRPISGRGYLELTGYDGRAVSSGQ